jgi:hypothetical protein
LFYLTSPPTPNALSISTTANQITTELLPLHHLTSLTTSLQEIAAISLYSMAASPDSTSTHPSLKFNNHRSRFHRNCSMSPIHFSNDDAADNPALSLPLMAVLPNACWHPIEI